MRHHWKTFEATDIYLNSRPRKSNPTFCENQYPNNFKFPKCHKSFHASAGGFVINIITFFKFEKNQTT